MTSASSTKSKKGGEKIRSFIRDAAHHTETRAISPHHQASSETGTSLRRTPHTMVMKTSGRIATVAVAFRAPVNM